MCRAASRALVFAHPTRYWVWAFPLTGRNLAHRKRRSQSSEVAGTFLCAERVESAGTSIQLMGDQQRSQIAGRYLTYTTLCPGALAGMHPGLWWCVSPSSVHATGNRTYRE